MPKKTRVLTEEVDIMVKVDSNGKIIAYNTEDSDVILPDEVLNTDWRAWTYNLNNQKWTFDEDYVPPTPVEPEF